MAADRCVTGVLCGCLLGVLVQVRSATVSSDARMVALAAAGVSLLCVATGLRKARALRFLLALAGAALMSHAWADWRAQMRLDDRLADSLEGVALQIEGVVASLPVQRVDGVRFVFEVESASSADGRPLAIGPDVPRRLMLGWYRGQQDEVVASWPDSRLAPGQRWRWDVRLRRPHGNVNPHGFDFELWLFEQGVRASGYVRATPVQPPRLLDEESSHLIERWRHRVRSAIFAQVGDRPSAGILAGLAIGDQAAIERADWSVFRTTGVAHLLAVSGLHITLFAWVASAALSRLWRCSPACMLRWPAPQAARWGGLLAAAGYALLAGWGVPAQRTVYMLATFTALRSLGLQWPMAPVLLACATVVVLADPWALLQPGFWLSFCAVALLALSSPVGYPQAGSPSPADARAWLRCPPAGRWLWIRERVQGLLRSGWRSQWVVTVGLAPWTLIFFNQVSLVGLVANAFAIPIVTLLLTPLALLGMLAAPCWSLAAWLADAMMAVLRLLAQWPGASWRLPAAEVWAQGLGVAGAFLLVMPWPGSVRLLGVGFLVPLSMPLVPRPPMGEFDLLGVDIGQGNAVLVRTGRHTLLFDTGPVHGRDSDAGERVLSPLLAALGEGRLDLLVLSHRDADHTGGAASVLRDPGAVRVLSSLEPGHGLRGRAPHQACEAGQVWRWDGIEFRVLHPMRSDYLRAAAGTLKPNGLSCVLRISNGRRTVLLTGDIEREQELRILARHGANNDTSATEISPAHDVSLQADVLLVPHHGSRTSSTQNWIEAVKPRWALVQAGYRNRYGHPVPDVLERYRAHGAGVIRTDSCGAWHWNSADAVQWCERQRRPRYWHAPLQGDGLEFANETPSSNDIKP